MLALLLLAGLSSPAHAGDCRPLYENELAGYIDASYAAINREGERRDLEEHERLSRVIETRLPCAEFEVRRRLWARYLVSLAIREYYAAGDWEAPITTALRIDPELAIPVRPGHQLTTYEPSPRPASRGPIPEGVRVLLDGSLLEEVVPLDALHLLQRRDGDDWQTMVVRGPSEIPVDWLRPPRLPSVVIRERRRKAIHGIGTAASAVFLSAGVATLALGLDARAKFYRNEDKDSIGAREQQDRNNMFMPIGISLLGAAGGGAALTWVIPW